MGSAWVYCSYIFPFDILWSRTYIHCRNAFLLIVYLNFYKYILDEASVYIFWSFLFVICRLCFIRRNVNEYVYSQIWENCRIFGPQWQISFERCIRSMNLNQKIHRKIRVLRSLCEKFIIANRQGMTLSRLTVITFFSFFFSK